MLIRTIVATVIAAALAALVAVPGHATAMSYRQAVVNAPEFPEGLEWLNTERPLTMRELRGKVVLLDFWTYCCINCMHIIPDLERLEAKYGDALVVVGVHSAKFTTEKETDNIRQAILRYGIEHPVVNDRDFEVWDRYAARAWPTLVLVDARGKIVGQASGEGVFETFDGPVGQLVESARASGTLDTRPLALALERDRAPRSLLAYPGKVLADPASKRLFIADSNHNRIVVAGLDGAVVDVVGSGREGLDDGSFERATFLRPQGMALSGSTLYVADTENHAIRRVDLERREVVTIAGNGEQAREFNVGGVGMAVRLNSPWDLHLHDGALYVAMAGSHQIWRMDLKTWRLDPYAGSSRESRVDGPLAEAALAQPSGLASDGKRLFVADSEVSAIRTVDFDPRGRVGTVVGLALFEFGDRDGAGDEVRLQHPLGVAWHDGKLLVADTYNNKIKRIDPKRREARTLAGSGEGGFKDGKASEARFDEPGGLSVAGGRLYVADTNNGSVRVVDLATGSVSTLRLTGLERFMAAGDRSRPYGGETVDLAPQRVAPGAAEVVFDLTLSERLKPGADAPFFFGLSASEQAVVEAPPGASTTNPAFPRRLPFVARSGSTTLTLETVLYYCEEGRESLCYVKQVRFRVPLTVEPGAPSTVRVPYRLDMSSRR